MSDSLNPAHRVENMLRAKQAWLEAELASVKTMLAEFDGTANAHPASAPSAVDSEAVTPPNRGQFAGLVLIDAVVKHLELSGKKLRSVKEIWEALSAEGFKVLSGHPTRAINEALRKRVNRKGDVFAAGNRWGYSNNFTQNWVSRLTKKYAGMGGKSADEHSAKTIKGMRKARANGKRLGAKSKLNAENVAQLKRLLDGGASIDRACRAINVSVTTFYNHRNLVEVWQEGQPWPPPGLQPEYVQRDQAEKQERHLRIVNS